MERLLIWTKGDAKGWACSNCQWRFPIPTLLSGEEAISAYNRLAAWKFREHKCEATGDLSAASQEPKRDAGNAFGKLTMDQNETREKRNVKLRGFIDGRRITHDLAEFFGRQYFTRRCLWRMQTPQKPQERLLARRKQVWKNA